MKYVILAFVLIAIGITTAVPAALAGDNGADVCYVDGVARSCITPAPVNLYSAPDLGTIAGAAGPFSVYTSRENGHNR